MKKLDLKIVVIVDGSFDKMCVYFYVILLFFVVVWIIFKCFCDIGCFCGGLKLFFFINWMCLIKIINVIFIVNNNFI